MVEFLAVERLAREVKRQRPDIKICLFENIQAVTSFSLEKVAKDFLSQDTIDVIILGEPESRAPDIANNLLTNSTLLTINGLIFNDDKNITIHTKKHDFENIDQSTYFPAWKLFPLEGYWKVGFSHAPCETSKFLPILTSRGCPYKCTFCITPFLNPKWRGRDARDTVDEIEYFFNNMDITEFHISDLNPTVDDKRTREICELLIERKLPIIWKVAQGTKIETIRSEQTLALMAKSGCNFLAFSPESGSKRLMKLIKKPFDYEHGLKMAKIMYQLNISTQACFIAGLPEETRDDQKKTLKYMRKLVIAGVDEISCYIFTPVPGAELSNSFEGYEHYSQCSPSPSWRKDYYKVMRFRIEMYLTYFVIKGIFHPTKSFQAVLRFFSGNYRTKMEMSLYKQLKLYILRYAPFILKNLDVQKQIIGILNSNSEGISSKKVLCLRGDK